MVNPSWGSFQKPNQPEQELSPEFSEKKQEFAQELPRELEDSQKPEAEKPQWGNFENTETYQGPPDPTVEESTLGYFVRNIAANASRLGEQVLGRYGNIEKMGKDILSNLPEAGGVLGWGLSKLMGQERWDRMVKGQPGREQIAPTSEQLKKVSHQLTGEYTKPKTKGEGKFQGFIEDIGSTLGSATGRASTPRNIAINNLGIPIAANGVKEIVEDLGFGKDKGTVAKLGTWTALSLLGNVNAPQYASELMNRGRNGIPVGVNIDVVRLQNRLQQVSRDPHLLHADPRSALARQELAAIQNDLANGQTNVRSLMTTYDGINAAKRNRGLFELNSSDRNFAKRAIDRVRDTVRDEIMDAAANYPQALDSWRNGIQAWAVIHQSKALTNWVDQLAKGPYSKILSGPAAALFGVSAYGGFKAPIVAGPASVAIPTAYKSAQTAYRVWNDPNLQRYYWRAISAAQAENIPAFINNYNKLNKSLEKSDSVKKNTKSKK